MMADGDEQQATTRMCQWSLDWQPSMAESDCATVQYRDLSTDGVVHAAPAGEEQAFHCARLRAIACTQHPSATDCTITAVVHL